MSPLLTALLGLVEAVAQAEGPALVAALAKWLNKQNAQALTPEQQMQLARLAADAEAKVALG